MAYKILCSEQGAQDITQEVYRKPLPIWLRLDIGGNKGMSQTDLTKIPGIGNKMAEHLTNAGYPTIESLKGQSPDEIYLKDCLFKGFEEDRCALYCYRLAVHFADNNGVLPTDKQNWWDWKD